jgi:uncharacterized protein YndB with AHSA1/START domain
MPKQPYHIEYVLNGNSFPSIWTAVSTPGGLSKWFADEVETIDEKILRFKWKDQTQDAVIKTIKHNELIRLHWNDQDDKTFFQLKLTKDELTGLITLIVDDYCFAEDLENEKMFWNYCIEKLKRNLGF